MPANPLFWAVLLATAGAYVATLGFLYSEDEGADFHAGRVPGHSYTDGANVGLDASVVPLAEGTWMPLRLETLHTSGRTRLVLAVVFQMERDAPDELRDFFERLAETIRERAEADVVYIEGARERELGGPWRYLYAPDGGGWSGDEAVRAGYRSPLGGATLEGDG